MTGSARRVAPQRDERTVGSARWAASHLRLAVTALALLVATAGVAHAGDGAQFSGDCGSTYVNKKVGSNEQWAITWQVEGDATGNVLKLDGSAPSFIECELLDEDFDAQTLTFDCYGSSACSSVPCGASQWSLIASNLVIPVSFFVPPGVDLDNYIDTCVDRFGN